MTGDTIDIDHRSVDWSRDTITTSGGAWPLASHQPVYRSVKFRPQY